MRLFGFINGLILALFISIGLNSAKAVAAPYGSGQSKRCGPWIADLTTGVVKRKKGNFKCYSNLQSALKAGFLTNSQPGNPPVVPPAEGELNFTVSGSGTDYSKTFRFTRFPVQVTWNIACPSESESVLLYLIDPKSGSGVKINDSGIFAPPTKSGTKLTKEEYKGELRIKAEADNPSCNWELKFEQGV